MLTMLRLMMKVDCWPLPPLLFISLQNILSVGVAELVDVDVEGGRGRRGDPYSYQGGSRGGSRGGGQLEQEELVVEEESGVVTALWVSVLISSLILLLCIAFFLILKFNLLPSKSSLRRGSSSRRRQSEAHPLSHQHQPNSPVSPTSNYPDDFSCLGEGLGALSLNHHLNLSYIAGEEEKIDWGSRLPLLLTSLPCIPRSQVILPTDDATTTTTPSLSPMVPLAVGRWGPFFLSSQGPGPTPQLLIQLPSPSAPPPNANGKGKASSSSSWDSELFSALSSVTRPSGHPNVIGLTGFLSTREHLFLTAPLSSGGGGGGTLKHQLLKLREQQGQGNCLNMSSMAQELVLCAMGVAEGLFHLHSYQVVHAKLSSWAVLVEEGDWRTPKLTGWGVLHSNPPHKELDRRRWMSVEELHSRVIPPCDSWSFGVLLWEMVSLGGTPFGELTGDEVKKRVERGARPPQGEFVGDGIYQLMLTCWQLDRAERPTPEQLACQLHQLIHSAQSEIGIGGIWGHNKLPAYMESLEFISTK